MNFLDPVYDTEGNPYGPTRYRELVKERFYITKHCNTSYEDVGNMTPTERIYILKTIAEDLRKSDELMESIKSSRK